MVTSNFLSISTVFDADSKKKVAHYTTGISRFYFPQLTSKKKFCSDFGAATNYICKIFSHISTGTNTNHFFCKFP